MTQSCEKYIRRPEWQHLPPLSRIILGTRKEKRLSLRELSRQIATSEDDTQKIADQIETLESGGPIEQRLFEFLLPLLDLDPDELFEVINEQRLEDLRESEEWDFEARAIEITCCFSKSVGVTRAAPHEVKTPRDAEAYASSVARDRGIPVFLNVRRRVRMTFDNTGKLSTIERMSPAGWSHYPFGAGMHSTPPLDEREGDVLTLAATKNGIRSMAEALCRAQGLDPEGYRDGLPGWYSVVDPAIAVLFKGDEFWEEVAAREGKPLGLNDVFEDAATGDPEGRSFRR